MLVYFTLSGLSFSHPNCLSMYCCLYYLTQTAFFWSQLRGKFTVCVRIKVKRRMRNGTKEKKQIIAFNDNFYTASDFCNDVSLLLFIIPFQFSALLKPIRPFTLLCFAHPFIVCNFPIVFSYFFFFCSRFRYFSFLVHSFCIAASFCLWFFSIERILTCIMH